ncbi:MAG: hypothetical protein ACRC6E_03910 [Fusobacteriaceae bacterium]
MNINNRLSSEELIELIFIQKEKIVKLRHENIKIKEELCSVKREFENIKADIRVNINNKILNIVGEYCNNKNIAGVNREILYCEIYKVVYTGFCKEYNVDFKDIKVSLNTGKPTDTEQSFIKIIESMGLQGLLADYIGSISPSELKMSI